MTHLRAALPLMTHDPIYLLAGGDLAGSGLAGLVSSRMAAASVGNVECVMCELSCRVGCVVFLTLPPRSSVTSVLVPGFLCACVSYGFFQSLATRSF